MHPMRHMVGNFGTNAGVVSPWPLVSKLADFREPLFPGQGEKVGCFYMETTIGGFLFLGWLILVVPCFGARERKLTIFMETNTGGRNRISGGK